AVEAVHRRHEELVEAVVERQVDVDLLVGAGQRLPGLGVELVLAGGDDERQDPDRERDDEQHGEGAGEPPAPRRALAVRRAARRGLGGLRLRQGLVDRAPGGLLTRHWGALPSWFGGT